MRFVLGTNLLVSGFIADGLARRVGRDVKRVHDDVGALGELGLVERTEAGGVLCPFSEIHIDMHLLAPQGLAA